MTKQEQVITIATFCGWQKCLCSAIDCCLWYDESQRSVIHGAINLSLMHEAEKYLTTDHWQIYFDALVEMIGGSVQNPRHDAYPTVVHASASQRAAAFIKTIGKQEQTGMAK